MLGLGLGQPSKWPVFDLIKFACANWEYVQILIDLRLKYGMCIPTGTMHRTKLSYTELIDMVCVLV